MKPCFRVYHTQHPPKNGTMMGSDYDSRFFTKNEGYDLSITKKLNN